jgi:hypothetical protein
MSYNIFPKGSEWRKWDLHVHTPSSYLSQYPDDWDVYVKALIGAVKKHEISVIVTADYFTIDGYRKLMTYYDVTNHTLSKGNDSVEVYIIPGVELRLDTFNSREESINFHVVFDSYKCSVDFIEQNFLEKLKVKYQGSTTDLRERNLLAIGYSIVNGEALDLLRDYSGLSESDKSRYLKEAYKTITLSVGDIKSVSSEISKIFEDQHIPRNPFLKLIAGKGHGSLKSLKWFDDQGQLSRAGLTRESLTNLTDLIFSNDPDDINFYLGKHPRTDATEIRQRFGDLKPCVWGSDCHSIGTLLHPSNGNSFLYTWIKADPTFEGLKQVVFEPNDRVVIQEERPDPKTEYHIIDKVRFLLPTEKLFSEEYIEINPNMNVIIGGKSSGKSLLLYHIAKTIDPIQVDESTTAVEMDGYDFERKYSRFNFEVVWKDGYLNSLREDDSKKARQITYLPQMYINHLAEKRGEQKLKNLIEDILNQNNDFKDFIDKKRTKIQSINYEISNNINERFAIVESIHELYEEVKAIGDKKAIEGNILKTKKEIEDLRKKADFTEDENNKFDALVHRRDSHQSILSTYEIYAESLRNHINSLRADDSIADSKIRNKKEKYLSSFENDVLAENFIEEESEFELAESDSYYKKLVQKHEVTLGRIEKKVQKHRALLAGFEDDLKPFLTRIRNQQHLKKLREDLSKEEQKLLLLSQKSKVYKDLVDKGKGITDSLLSLYAALNEVYIQIESKLQEPALSKIGSLELKSEMTFNVVSFSEGFCNLLDGRSNFKSAFGDFFGDQNEYLYTPESHLGNIKQIFEKVKAHEKNGIKFKTGVDLKDICFKLFEDYFTLKYTIRQNEDDILHMSPGKRGLILLQVILHLSNASHPILIDQPEDNLDNRTIFTELNEFIKEKKVQRQIIIVTHNSNLVVSTDSEQIIVANQTGQVSGKENREFVFEYVTGALEFSFEDKSKSGILYKMGIREHVCDILEGGVYAFKKRERKYGF